MTSKEYLNNSHKISCKSIIIGVNYEKWDPFFMKPRVHID